jgi:foldase protein PrsA
MCVAMSLLALTSCTGGSSADAVAVVNGREITKAEFDKQYRMFEFYYKKKYGEESLNQVTDGKTVRDAAKEKILEDLVRNIVIEEYVKSKGYTPPKEEVDKAVASFKDYINSDDEQKLFLEEAGIDDAYITRNIESQLYQKEFNRMVADETELDQKKLQEMYKTYIVKVKASHILLDKEADAKAVLEQLKGGAVFEDLARTMSTDTGSAKNGGSLGYFTRGQMVAEFEAAAFSTEKGEISDIVKTQYGYHIIKVFERKTIADLEKDGEKEQSLSKLRTSVLEDLTDQNVTAKTEALVKDAKVTRNLELAKK